MNAFIFDNNDLHFYILIFIYDYFNIKHFRTTKQYAIIRRIY